MEKFLGGFGPKAGSVGRQQDGGVGGNLFESRDFGGDNGASGLHRFEDREAEAFVAGRKDEGGGGLVEADEFGIGDLAEGLDAGREFGGAGGLASGDADIGELGKSAEQLEVFAGFERSDEEEEGFAGRADGLEEGSGGQGRGRDPVQRDAEAGGEFGGDGARRGEVAARDPEAVQEGTALAEVAAERVLFAPGGEVMDHGEAGDGRQERDEETSSEECVDTGAAELEGEAVGPPAAFERGLRGEVEVRQILVGGEEDVVTEAAESIHEFEDVTADSAGRIDEGGGVDGEAHGRLEGEVREAEPHPVDEGFGGGHGGEAGLTDEGPIGEESGGFDFGEGRGGIEAAEEFEFDDGGFGVLGVVGGVREDESEAEDGGMAHRMVDKDEIAGAHGADGPDGLRIADAIPNCFLILLKSVDRVGVRISLGEEVRHNA